MRQLAVFGCGGHARSVLNALKRAGNTDDILLVDENAREDETVMGYKVYAEITLEKVERYFLAIGDNTKRKRYYECIMEKCNNMAEAFSVIAKSSIIGEDVKLGKGIYVGENAFIGPEAEIGINTIINTGSIVEHEVKLGDFCHIAPRTVICGRSQLGNNVFLGAGSVVIDNVKICSNVTIGAGAVVNRDINEEGTYVGCPIRKVK